MKHALLLIPLLAFGCKATRFTIIQANGTTIKGSDYRMMMRSTFNANYSTNGATEVRVGSSAQGEIIADITQAAVKGAVQGAK